MATKFERIYELIKKELMEIVNVISIVIAIFQDLDNISNATKLRNTFDFPKRLVE